MSPTAHFRGRSVGPLATSSPRRSRDRLVVAACAALVAAMTALSFAAVPLYRLFCQVTGYEGTTRRASVAPDTVLARSLTIDFDANVGPGISWRFEPAQKVRIAPGAQTQVFYRATNLTARPLTGQAVFNVTPDQAGKYFNKIECFCFTEQTLAPGQSVKMPILFFIDPAILKDEDTKNIDEITLSYTFYPVETGATGR